MQALARGSFARLRMTEEAGCLEPVFKLCALRVLWVNRYYQPKVRLMRSSS